MKYYKQYYRKAMFVSNVKRHNFNRYGQGQRGGGAAMTLNIHNFLNIIANATKLCDFYLNLSGIGIIVHCLCDLVFP